MTELKNYERFVGMKEEREAYELLAEGVISVVQDAVLIQPQISLDARKTASNVVGSALSAYSIKFRPIN